jgi:hypothetical protein
MEANLILKEELKIYGGTTMKILKRSYLLKMKLKMKRILKKKNMKV